MPVTDSTLLRQKTARLVNVDNAACVALDNYIAAQYNLPASMRFEFHGGTNPIWSYDPNRFTTFWTPWRNHLVTTGARAVVAIAGCPVAMYLKTFDGTSTNGCVDFARTAALGKRVYNRGQYGLGEVRSFDGSGGAATLATGDNLLSWGSAYNRREMTLNHLARAHPANSGYWTSTAYSPQYQGHLELYNDPVLEAAWVAAGSDGMGAAQRQFVRYTLTWDEDYSRFDALPCGLFGWRSDTGVSTFPADLYDKSVAIIDAGIAAEWTLEAAKANMRIFAAFSSPGGDFETCNVSKQALMVYKLKQEGFQNVTYYYDDTAQNADLGAMILCPLSGGIQTTGMGDWNRAGLEGHTVSNPASVTFDFGFGGAFMNDNHAAYTQHMIPSFYSFWTGGASNFASYLAYTQASPGWASAFYNPYTWTAGNWHQNAGDASASYNVVQAIIDGYSLLEAGFLGHEDCYYPSGNPFMRLIHR